MQYFPGKIKMTGNAKKMNLLFVSLFSLLYLDEIDLFDRYT